MPPEEIPANDVPAQLLSLVRSRMPDGPETVVRVIAATTGLLASLAYADQYFSLSEQRRLVQMLVRVQGIDGADIGAIVGALRGRELRVTDADAREFCRTLRALATQDLRREVVDLMIELAAADGSICDEEQALLDACSESLGVDSTDYGVMLSRQHARLSGV